MNCLDFRRDALAQPLRLGDEAQAHSQSCPGCAEFLERQRHLDAELFEAMRVPVPDGLADRIVLAHGIRRRRQSWLWAAAASLVVAIGAALVAPPYLAGSALAHEAIAHVAEEPQALRLVAQYSPDLLPGELATQGVRLAADIGRVTYSILCPMRSGSARHMVVATADGPVTLLLMPKDTRQVRRTVTDADGMSAITLPTARGSLAIVAANRQLALAVERLLILA